MAAFPEVLPVITGIPYPNNILLEETLCTMLGRDPHVIKIMSESLMICS
jgi:hypothetical protein